MIDGPRRPATLKPVSIAPTAAAVPVAKPVAATLVSKPAAGWVPKAVAARPVKASVEPPYNAAPDASALYKAMKGGIFGAGTDEAAIFRTLEGKSPGQIGTIKKTYADHYKRDLVTDLNKELSGTDQTRARALLKGDASAAAAEQLYGAMKGMGTNESSLFGALQGKKPEDLKAIKQSFETNHGSLDHALSKELGGSDLIRARALLNSDAAGADAASLRKAMSGLGTDEQALFKTLEGKGPAARAAILASYKNQTGSELSTDLNKELTGPQRQQAQALLKGDAVGAAAARLKAAMKGMGTDESAIMATLEGKSGTERAAIAAEYKKVNGVELLSDLHKELRGEDLLRAKSLLTTGKVSDVEELRMAMTGMGTDEAKITQVLAGRTREEIAQLKTDYQAQFGSDLVKDLRGEVGGRDAFELKQNLAGIPTSPEQALKKMNEARAFERSGLANAASKFVMDGLNGKGKLLDGNIDRANTFYADAKKDGKLDAVESQRLGELIGYTQDDVSLYRESKDSAGNAVATVVTTTAAIGIAVATAGAGTPLVVAALAGAGGGATARVVTKGLIAGQGYSAGAAALDGAIGAADGVSSLIGGGAAQKVVSGAMGSVLKAEGSVAARVAISAVDGATQGAVSGGINGASGSAFTDSTWDKGIVAGVGNVAKAGALGAAFGAATSGTIGGLKGLAPPKVVYVSTNSDVGGEKIDLSRYQSDVSTRAQSKEWLTENAYKYESKVRDLQAANPGIAKIPKEDLMALKAYTGDYYRKMNSALRGETALWKTQEGMASGVKGASSALNQLPSHQGTVFRGAHLDPAVLDKYVKGEVIAEKAFLSTTLDESVAKNFGNANTLFVINAVKNGRDVSFLSDYAAEKEVLFTPGTAFKVLSKDLDKTTGRTTVYLSEVVK